MSSADKNTRTPADGDARKRPTGPEGKSKRAWQAPRIRTGHLFESNSLACGKSTPQIEQCIQNPVTS
jgi:hypothetical protein